LRVIAGEAKGRRLVSVPGTGTRPITDRVKEALFDILGSEIEGTAFLDLFAGTGSVGIEALSRGAGSAVFVDRSRRAIDTVRRNLAITGLSGRAQVIRRDAFSFLSAAPTSGLFDYVYVAPPQYRGLWAKALLAVDGTPLLAPGGLVIVQIHPKEFRELLTTRLRLGRQRRYGSTMLCFYHCDPATEALPPPGEHGADEPGQGGE